MVGKTSPIKVGPWGGSKGSPFDITKPSERLESMAIQFGRVINSFGFTYVDALGQKHDVGPVDGDGRGKLTTVVAAKIGVWGGDGGTEFDVTEPPMRLESMTISAGDSVDSIGFSYVDETGHKHNVGPFGGTGGQPATIKLAPVEYVQRFFGTIGEAFGSEPRTFVASLHIGTNMRTYGPYGKRLASGDQFSIPLPENASVVGFFGRAGNLLDAIGVYIAYNSPIVPIAHHATEETSSGNDKDEEAPKNTTATASPPPVTITGQTVPIKIGPWGSSKKPSLLGETFGILGWGGGPSPTEFDATEPPKRLDGVMIRSGDIVDAFGFSYTDEAGQKHTVGPYGGSGGNLTTIQLEPSEYVKHFSGTTGAYVGSPVVASLKIETNLRVYGPYGKDQDKHFSLPLPENATVVGFFGSADNILDAIGVYVSSFISN